MTDSREAQPVLVVNAGSSSLKYQLVDATTETALAKGSVERIGERGATARHESGGDTHTVERPIATHRAALAVVADAFRDRGPSFDDVGLVAVGHRVVHGGDRFSNPVVVTDEVLAAVEELEPLAPLHNPATVEGIKVSRERFPDVPQVAVFDTAFHHALPAHSYTYAVPRSWRDEHRVRRYGFHGTSHQYVSGKVARVLGRRLEDLNQIVLHLGNGASASAVIPARTMNENSPGSMSPERVPITRPSSGVSPMDVSMLRPPEIAAALAPFPRWRTTRSRSATGALSRTAERRVT